jgi:hypothetical protein
MRIYDHLRSMNFRAERFMDFAYLARPEFMNGSEVILADNVADYVAQQSFEKRGRNYDPEAAITTMDAHFEFPTLAPSFPKMFIEYHFPASWIGVLLPNVRIHGLVKLGAFVFAREFNPELRARIRRRFSKDIRWKVAAGLYLEPIPYRILGPILRLHWTVRSDGGHNGIFISLPDEVKAFAKAKYPQPDCAGMESLCSKLTLTPLLLTICFMNCKNVVISTIAERSQPKEFKRRSAEHYTEYKILDIHPMREVLRTEGRVHEVGIAKALHICRGHFKTYTSNSPLFGKVEGTFWWGNFARGSGPGTIVKDYRLHPPEKERNKLLDGKIS